MALLYNNIRVKEFRDQRNKVTRTHEELEELKVRIDRWNQVLHRKETNASEAESGLLIDIDDCLHKLKRLRKKQRRVHEDQEKALKQASLLERFFIWLYYRVNNVIFMHNREVDEVAGAIKNGTYILPNPVIDYYIQMYIKTKEEKIRIHEVKLETLRVKLDPSRMLTDVMAFAEERNENEAEQNFKKDYTTFGLLWKILVMLGRFVFSSTQEICFLLMIVAQICNGNLLSLVYVMSIFFYGLVRRNRPHWRYWAVMRMYAGLVIIAKYFCVFIESVLVYRGTSSVLREYQAEVFSG